MLPWAARSPCWRISRLRHHRPAVPRSTAWMTPSRTTQLRVFSVHNSSLRKQDSKGLPSEQKTSPSAAGLDSKPTDPKTNDPKNATAVPKKDLLSEAVVGKQEQRKADWAIMKEMAKYLWPKVMRLGLWMGRRVVNRGQCRMTGARSFASERPCPCWSGRR